MGDVRNLDDPTGELAAGAAAPPEVTANRDHGETPIPMVLHCPRCCQQHIDEATDTWNNPPHRSHACQTPGCGTIWRPADIATEGVPAIVTRGQSDNWFPDGTLGVPD